MIVKGVILQVVELKTIYPSFYNPTLQSYRAELVVQH